MRRLLGAVLTVGALLLAMSVSACGGDSAQYLVCVENSRAAAITVRIGPADYGTVAPQTTTDYKEVSEGENVVLVNGVESSLSPASFGEGLTGTHRWTYFFGEDSEGFSTDDPIFRIAALTREQAVRW